MSVRVNLLPQATKERDRAGRQRVLAVVLVLALLVALGGATFWQRTQLGTAEDELADAQQELSLAQAEVQELAEFANLADTLAEVDEVVAMTLGDQASFAGVLQDLALTMPEDSALTSLSVQFAGRGEETQDGIGLANLAVETVTGVAPGVERLLLSLERVAGFADVHLGSATVDEEDVTTFSLDVQIGREHYTERFRDGLPEVRR